MHMETVLVITRDRRVFIAVDVDEWRERSTAEVVDLGSCNQQSIFLVLERGVMRNAEANSLMEYATAMHQGQVADELAAVAWVRSLPHLLKRGLLDPREYILTLEKCVDTH
jgi:hypothetical protein